MVQTQEKTCEDRVQERYSDKIETMEMYMQRERIYENGNDDYPPFHEYGICFDYVEPMTFQDQREGYLRYQLSWGGPSDEFRFFINPDGSVHTIEYWFMDWFDGASVEVEGGEFNLMLQVFDNLTGGDPLYLINEQ